MKIIAYDKLNHELILFERLFLVWCKRNGRDYVIMRECGFNIFLNTAIHTRGYYIQLGKYGGHIMWKSSKCAETE